MKKPCCDNKHHDMNEGSWSKEEDEKPRGNFGEDEEDLIIRLHALLGNRWSLIAGRIPGRTDYEIENHWNSYLRIKLLNMGIDPNNHRVGQSMSIATSVTENEQVHSGISSTRNYNSHEDQEVDSSPPDLN